MLISSEGHTESLIIADFFVFRTAMDSNKNMPTAPPSYADSMNPVQTSMYPSINIDHNIPVGVPQMEAPQQPTQVIVVQQTNSGEYLKINHTDYLITHLALLLSHMIQL